MAPQYSDAYIDQVLKELEIDLPEVTAFDPDESL